MLWKVGLYLRVLMANGAMQQMGVKYTGRYLIRKGEKFCTSIGIINSLPKQKTKHSQLQERK